MKILGIGVDLVRNSRISHFIHQSYVDRFLEKFLHHHEQLVLMNIANEREKVEYLASRWAVKEALNKAIGRK
jgi:holo-[acyl-carrier protein] synthase